jgi:hypothetical protein
MRIMQQIEAVWHLRTGALPRSQWSGWCWWKSAPAARASEEGPMKERFGTVLLAMAIAGALGGCSRANNDGATGNADRAAPAGARNGGGGSSYVPPTGPAPIKGTDGSTAGAAAGSLDTHDRGGGSDGAAGTSATPPRAGTPPYIDPSHRGSHDGNRGSRPDNTRDPSVPDPQGKQ